MIVFFSVVSFKQHAFFWAFFFDSLLFFVDSIKLANNCRISTQTRTLWCWSLFHNICQILFTFFHQERCTGDHYFILYTRKPLSYYSSRYLFFLPQFLPFLFHSLVKILVIHPLSQVINHTMFVQVKQAFLSMKSIILRNCLVKLLSIKRNKWYLRIFSYWSQINLISIN